MKLLTLLLLSLCLLSSSFSQTLWAPGGYVGTSSNGYVGIGTGAPSTLLHIRKDNATAMGVSHIYSTDISGIRFSNLSTSANAGVVLNFQLGSTGTSHAAFAASRPSANHSILHFYTEHSNIILERMRISSNGNVGIGESSPLSKLHLVDDINSEVLRVESSSNSSQLMLSSTGTGGSNWLLMSTANGASIGGGKFSLYGDSNHRFVIDNAGNIGIGITAPETKLDVNGDIQSDFLRVNAVNSIEGGEIRLDGSSGYNDWRIDNRTGHFRLHHSGTSYLQIDNSGKVGIGTTDFTGNHKLRVEGSIGAREIKVEASGWSDFVFEKNYDLKTLEEVESYITKEGHLPEIPSAEEVETNGINLGEMNAKLLQKIEELTLYLIEEHKNNKKLQLEVEALKKELSEFRR